MFAARQFFSRRSVRIVLTPFSSFFPYFYSKSLGNVFTFGIKNNKINNKNVNIAPS